VWEIDARADTCETGQMRWAYRGDCDVGGLFYRCFRVVPRVDFKFLALGEVESGEIVGTPAGIIPFSGLAT
jgi:hypothetical protein